MQKQNDEIKELLSSAAAEKEEINLITSKNKTKEKSQSKTVNEPDSNQNLITPMKIGLIIDSISSPFSLLSQKNTASSLHLNSNPNNTNQSTINDFNISSENSNPFNSFAKINISLPKELEQQLPKKSFQSFFNNKKLITEFSFSCCFNENVKRNKIQGEKEFSQKIIHIGDISNVEEFWQIFQHLKKINKCKRGSEYHLFKKGIKPMWEDKANKKGGKLSVLLCKEFCGIIWEEVVFSFCRGFLPYWEFINGLVISLRPDFAILSFWIKKIKNDEIIKEENEESEVVNIDVIKGALSEFIQAPFENCFDYSAFK